MITDEHRAERLRMIACFNSEDRSLVPLVERCSDIHYLRGVAARHVHMERQSAAGCRCPTVADLRWSVNGPEADVPFYAPQPSATLPPFLDPVRKPAPPPPPDLPREKSRPAPPLPKPAAARKATTTMNRNTPDESAAALERSLIKSLKKQGLRDPLKAALALTASDPRRTADDAEREKYLREMNRAPGIERRGGVTFNGSTGTQSFSAITPTPTTTIARTPAARAPVRADHVAAPDAAFGAQSSSPRVTREGNSLCFRAG